MNENMNECGLVLANGEIIPVVKELRFKEDVSEKNIRLVSKCTMNLIQNNTRVSQGHFSMVSDVAILLADNKFKYLSGVKSMNQFLQDIIKCSPGTASDLIKVAKTFYTEIGTLKDKEFDVFSFSELRNIAKYSEEVRNEVLTIIKGLPSHTRKDVATAVDTALNKLLGTTEESEESTNDKKESTNDKKESTNDKEPNEPTSSEESEQFTDDNDVTDADRAEYWETIVNDIYKELVSIRPSESKGDIVNRLTSLIDDIREVLNKGSEFKPAHESPFEES